MGWLQITGSRLDTPLMELLNSDEIQPGQNASYQLCKLIYEYHPLGAKMTETPIRMAMSQGREYVIGNGPEERLREQYEEQWKKDGHDAAIFMAGTLARVYGLAAEAVLLGNIASNTGLDYEKLRDPSVKMTFNAFDPLNMSGSLAMNQDPNSDMFMRQKGVVVQGKAYHSSRTVIMVCGNPIYLGYTVSAFGYTGRSVFQRALYPLKSYIQTMRTDDLVTRKVGVLIAKIKQAGSIVNGIMQRIAGMKRSLLKEAETDNVLSIDPTEDIESLNLQNLDAPYTLARKNILENVALCADMPAKIINMETFAEGFGEGTEDAKQVANYVDAIREWLEVVYVFHETINMYRAWTPEFYAALQADYAEYKSVTFETAFVEWKNSFRATWPEFLKEPPSERSKADKVKLDAVMQLLTLMLEKLPPEGQADFIDWACGQFNEMTDLFTSPIVLDKEELLKTLKEKKDQMDEDREAGLADAAGGDEAGNGAPGKPGTAKPPKPGLRAVQ